MIPLGTEVDLGPADIVLGGDPAPPQKGAQQPPTFQPMSVVAKWLVDQDTTWYGGRPRPADIVLGGDPAPPQKGVQQPPIFRPMSIVAKRSPISASAELLESIVVIINFQVYVLYHIMITRFLQLCINVYTFYFQSQFLLQVAADDVAVST